MLTGSLPFDDPSPTAVALQHLTLPPPKPRQINPHLSLETEEVLLKALRKAPSDRYRTGVELMDALGKALFGGRVIPPAALEGKPIHQPHADANGRPMSARGERASRSHTTVAERVALHLGASGTMTTTLETQRAHQSRAFRQWLLWRVGGGLLLVALIIVAVVALLRNTQATAVAIVATLETATVMPPSPSPSLSLGESVSLSPPTPMVTAITVVTVTVMSTVVPPTLAPTDTPESVPTVLYADGRELTMFYNGASFYVLNRSDAPVEIGRMAFELLNENGLPTRYRFDGRRWTQFYDYLDAGSCDVLELFDKSSAWLQPLSCGAYNARITPSGQDETIFWIPRAGETMFRVLWNEVEIGRCEIARHQCSLFVPG